MSIEVSASSWVIVFTHKQHLFKAQHLLPPLKKFLQIRQIVQRGHNGINGKEDGLLGFVTEVKEKSLEFSSVRKHLLSKTAFRTALLMQMQILVLLPFFSLLVIFLSCRSVNTIAIVIIFSIETSYEMSYLCNH